MFAAAVPVTVLQGIFASVVISLAMVFIPASYAAFVVSEKEGKSKHLQVEERHVLDLKFAATQRCWDCELLAFQLHLGLC